MEETPESPSDEEFMPSETQISRGAAALARFVESWQLPLNPEKLDLMAFAVIKHTQSTEAPTIDDYDRIDQDVKEMIAEDEQAQRAMTEAMQQS